MQKNIDGDDILFVDGTNHARLSEGKLCFCANVSEINKNGKKYRVKESWIEISVEEFINGIEAAYGESMYMITPHQCIKSGQEYVGIGAISSSICLSLKHSKTFKIE